MADVSPTKPSLPHNPLLISTTAQRRIARLVLYQSGGLVTRLTLRKTAAGAKVDAIWLDTLNSKPCALALSTKGTIARGILLEATVAAKAVRRLTLDGGEKIERVSVKLELDLNGPKP